MTNCKVYTPKRICCFCETWESGGIESFLNSVLLNIDLRNTQIDIVAACIKDSVFTAGLAARGIRFIELSGKLRHPKNFILFRNLLRNQKYDVVHFNLFQGLSLFYVQIAREEGVPVRIAHSHNTDLRKSRGRALKLLLHRIGSHLFSGSATDLWACSQSAAGFLFSKKILKEKGFQFIPNGITTQTFRFDPKIRDTVRSELNLTNTFVVGHIGRLCYQKNQNFLLDVFSEIVKQRSDSKLLLVGEGEQKAYLQEKADRLGLFDKIIFYGVTDHVEHLLCAMDVFAFPSLFEGLGIVAIEAQASGLPIICSEHVPPEAMVTPTAIRYALAHGTQKWAEQMLQFPPSSPEKRKLASDDVRAAGFDITFTARLFSTGCMLQTGEYPK